MYYIKKKAVITFFCCLFFVSCKTQESYVINDLLNLEQRHDLYSSRIKTQVMIPEIYHQAIDSQYNQKFFGPWYTNKASATKESLQSQFTRFKKMKGFGENKLELPKDWVLTLEENARLDKFPNFIRHAITVSNTNIRILPTKKAHFDEFTDHSSGYPFDNLQNSALMANTPILITHISKDNAWVYIETAFSQGWVSISDIAYAEADFKKEFQSFKTFVAAVEDDFPVKTNKGTYLFQGYIGMIFPLIKSTEEEYRVAVPMANSLRNAVFNEAILPKEVAQKKPLQASIENIAWLADKLINEPYGWGGLYQNRDCSAMLRDLYAPVGIWLPRNSKSQAKHAGTYIEIKHLNFEEKKEFILKKGIPYFTLLWFPGHIMLYIGEKDGEPLVFHNIWGLRTNTEEKRRIIGRSVITTLYPGKENKQIGQNGNFLSLLEGMTLLNTEYLEKH